MGAARNRTIASLVLLLILAACSREQGPASPAATLGAAPSETASAPSEAPSETEPADPYAIPADPKDIDKEYVERVLNRLVVSIAEAARIVAREKAITPAVRESLSDTHTQEAANGVVQAFRTVVRQDLISAVASPDAKPPVIQVKRVIGASSTCVFVLVSQDTSPLGGKEVRPFAAYYHLVADTQGDGSQPTPWVIAADAEPQQGKEYANPCT